MTEHGVSEGMSALDDTPDPRSKYQSPEMLICDASIDTATKIALLKEWDAEMDQRLNAESEGMSATDPMHHRFEARLADEAKRVKTALTELVESEQD